MAEFRMEFKEQIGGGGFADVFRAVRLDTGEEVAVKVLRDHKNADCRRRFEREVQYLLTVNHPSVVRILGHQLRTDPPYFVMPLMKHGNLTPWAGRLDFPVVRGLLRQLASVLQYLHGRGLLHRDFKPDNILVDADGNVAIGDFGLGNDPRFTVVLTVHAVGTPGYMAPELHFTWGRASRAADIYSLGATLFHLLTGIRPPVRLGASPLDPWEHNNSVPEDLRNLVLHMVQHDPRRRPSAAQIIEWLGLGSAQSGAGRVPVPPSAGKVLAVGGLAIAAVVALAGLFGGNE